MEKTFGVDPETKENINKQGWESSPEGGSAAVNIGSRKELDNLRENLNKGGLFNDAASYVQRNKKIIVTNNYVPEEIQAQAGKGWIGSSRLIYIGKDGITEVDINYDKIASIPAKAQWEKKVNLLVSELKQSGFEIKTGGFESEDKLLLKVLDMITQANVTPEKSQAKEKFNF